MGWAYGVDGNGREIGYGVKAECDHPDCVVIIDRGLSYRCGGLGVETDDTMPGCGAYFCGEHLFLAPRELTRDGSGLCEPCLTRLEEVCVERMRETAGAI